MGNPLKAASNWLATGYASGSPPPDDAEAPNDGTSAPIEGEQQDSEFGINFRDLYERDPDAVEALKQIILRREKDQIATRMSVLRRVAASRLYFDGLQEITWDENQGAFIASGGSSGPVSDTGDDVSDTTQGGDDDSMVIANVMRPHGVSIMSLLTAQRPKPRFWPSDAGDEDSVDAAEAASDIAKFIQQTNSIGALQWQEAYHLMTDGAVFCYTRYVTDAQRFGYRSVPITEPREVTTDPEGYVCPNCAADLPQLPAGGVCPNCGDDSVGPEHYHPPTTDTRDDYPVGNAQIPDGQVVNTIEGHLEVEVPYSADSVGGDMSEMQWLFYKKEFDRSAVRAAFPDRADDLVATMGDPMEQSERQARLGPKEAGYLSFNADNRLELLTVRRCWLRPSNFWLDIVADDVRQRLLRYFPIGAYVMFGGDTYLEARNEQMEKRWTMEHAYAGKGLNRAGLLQDLVGAQDIINSFWNIRTEAAEKGIPIRVFNSSKLSTEALAGIGTVGGELPVKLDPNESIENIIHQSDQVEVPGIRESIEDAMSLGELLSGDFAALQGAPENNIDTASGYSLAVNQAKGRFAPNWGESQRFWDATNFVGVECYLDEADPVQQVSLMGRDGKPVTKEIVRDAVRGQFMIYPESDPDIPTTFSEIGARMAALVANPSPAAATVVSHPGNAAQFRKFIGNDKLVIPGEFDYEHQMEEIEEMLESAPAMDPAGMAPPGSTIPVDPLLDNNEVHLEAIKTWAQSPEGRKAAMTNPQGYANVRLHAQEHQQQIMQAAMNAAMPPPGAAAPGPPQGGGTQ